MRVLYLCHRLPYPPDKGDKIRAFHQLRSLAAKHEVDLFTLADRPEDVANSTSVRKYCKRITIAHWSPQLARLRSLPYLCTQRPLTLPYFYSDELQTGIRRALLHRTYDRVLVYCSAMAQYVETVSDVPIITDLVDVDSDKWVQYSQVAQFPFSTVYRREGRLLQKYEQRVCQKSAAIVVTTEREAQLAQLLLQEPRVHVVRNGVDGEYFQPHTVNENARRIIAFLGDMAYFPNQQAVIYFAQKVLPLVRASVSDVQFVIIGRNPSRSVRRLREIKGVEVTGFVPDVRPYLAKAAVSVAPFLIAAGIQNKVLEAMASGVPVVATSRVIRSLSKDVGAMVDAGDTPEQMARAIVALLTNPELTRIKGMESRRRVTTDYDWQRSSDQLMRILQEPRSASVTYARS